MPRHRPSRLVWVAACLAGSAAALQLAIALDFVDLGRDASSRIQAGAFSLLVLLVGGYLMAQRPRIRRKAYTAVYMAAVAAYVLFFSARAFGPLDSVPLPLLALLPMLLTVCVHLAQREASSARKDDDKSSP